VLSLAHVLVPDCASESKFCEYVKVGELIAMAAWVEPAPMAAAAATTSNE
jgi:hypothetical protein